MRKDYAPLIITTNSDFKASTLKDLIDCDSFSKLIRDTGIKLEQRTPAP
jgi:hypothetical protein